MFKKGELRTGNWVKSTPISIPRLGISSSGYTVVTTYGIHVYEEGHNIDWKPITLTEEILLKCTDFRKTKVEGVDSFFNGDNLLIRIEDMRLFLHSELDGEVFGVRYIKYVHELQNIFFILEGFELNLQL